MGSNVTRSPSYGKRCSSSRRRCHTNKTLMNFSHFQSFTPKRRIGEIIVRLIISFRCARETSFLDRSAEFDSTRRYYFPKHRSEGGETKAGALKARFIWRKTTNNGIICWGWVWGGVDWEEQSSWDRESVISVERNFMENLAPGSTFIDKPKRDHRPADKVHKRCSDRSTNVILMIMSSTGCLFIVALTRTSGNQKRRRKKNQQTRNLNFDWFFIYRSWIESLAAVCAISHDQSVWLRV